MQRGIRELTLRGTDADSLSRPARHSRVLSACVPRACTGKDVRTIHKTASLKSVIYFEITVDHDRSTR